MAGACGRTYRIEPRIAGSTCQAIQQTAAGLLVPTVEIEADPGITITPPGAADCPQRWRVAIDAAWAQTGVLTLSRTLTSGNRVWEVITEVPPVTIPRAGVWEVNFQVRGVAVIPTNAATSQGLGVVAGLYANGALIAGSEVLTVFHTLPAGEPATQAQGTGTRQFMHSFAAGDQVQLAAFQLGATGTASVVSNLDGRCYITAHWVAPVGDTPV